MPVRGYRKINPKTPLAELEAKRQRDAELRKDPTYLKKRREQKKAAYAKKKLDPVFMRQKRESSRKASAKRRQTPKYAEYIIKYNSDPKIKEMKRKSAAKNADLRVATRYGLTLDQYIQLQNASSNLCMICRGAPSGRFNRLSIDHDHTTGIVRGLLCAKCNLALGLLNDNPALLLAAVSYLDAAKLSTSPVYVTRKSN